MKFDKESKSDFFLEGAGGGGGEGRRRGLEDGTMYAVQTVC